MLRTWDGLCLSWYEHRFYVMLTVRSIRNEDPPRLFRLWQRTQQRRDEFLPLPSLSFNQLQTQILGLPMLDAKSVMIAFEGDSPVGYVHTTFAPSEDGYSFDYTTGQICFLCVDPRYPDVPGAAATLIQAAEHRLTELGAQKIFGGSPSPSAPFYTGFYSGGEAIGFLQSDKTIIDAFHAANYQVHEKTVWFHCDLQNRFTPVTIETINYDAEFEILVSELPKARTWWEGCAFSNGIWLDATAFSIKSERPVARLRTRITYPDTESISAMYGGTWLASLMELRVHPDHKDKGMQKHLLEKLIRHLLANNQIVQVEAHVEKRSPLHSLLHSLCWVERNSGFVFVKEM